MPATAPGAGAPPVPSRGEGDVSMPWPAALATSDVTKALRIVM